jgi:LacI family transcriptional regulator
MVVFQDRATGEDTCSIRQDDRAGARLLGHHLLERGVRRLYLLLPEAEWPAMVERERGFREVMSGSSVEFTIVRCGNEGAADTVAAVRQMISAKGLPDAIVGGNDRMAIAALNLLLQQGVRVPEEVKVTGFNAFDSDESLVPALTTVRSAAYEIGQRGGEELFARLREGAFRTRQVMIPVTFQPGNTT